MLTRELDHCKEWLDLKGQTTASTQACSDAILHLSILHKTTKG